MLERKSNPDKITYDDCVQFDELESILIRDLINKGVDPGECCTCVLVVMMRAYTCSPHVCTCTYDSRVHAFTTRVYLCL